MKSKNIILIAVIVIFIAIVFYGFNESQHDPVYVEKVLKEREEKDRFMKTSAESPFANAKDDYNGLKYFDPDPAFRVIADLEYIKDRKMVLLGTSDGKQERYIEYAWAKFSVNGVSGKLLILEVADMGPFRGKLFLAFGDETSGRETYGAGRYLDVNKVPGSTTITLDFNYAYNPYCAYNDTFSCPFPPSENLLKVAINAGEKNYH